MRDRDRGPAGTGAGGRDETEPAPQGRWPARATMRGRRPLAGEKVGNKPMQTQLPLTIVSKGRFDKSEPTKHNGEDLDVPTFIRRGVVLN